MIITKLVYIFLPLIILNFIFVPGIIILENFKIKLNFFSIIVFSFILSLFSNYIFVFIIVYFNNYIFLLAWIYQFLILIIFFYKFKNISNYILYSYKDFVLFLNNNLKKKVKIFVVSLFLTIIFFSFYLQNLYNEINHSVFGYLRIFEMQDVVQNYDLWSKEYARGVIPETSYLRPHFLQINFALIYILLKSVYYEFLPLLILSFFSLIFIFIGFSIGIIKNNLFIFPISIFAVNILFENTFGQAFSGYLEVPMSLMMMTLMLSIYEFKKSGDTKFLIIIFFAYVVTFLTKEWTWLILSIITFYFLFFKKFFSYTINVKYKFLFLISFLFIISPFYIFQFSNFDILNNLQFLFKQLTFDKNFHISAGHDLSILETKSRISYAFKIFPDLLVLPLIFTFIYNYKDSVLNLFLFGFILQIGFWAYFSPQEFRYLYFTYFFFIFFGSINIVYIIFKFFNFFTSKFSKNGFIISFLILWIFSIFLYNKTLNKNQIEYKIFEKKVTLNFDKKIDKNINNYFYNYFKNNTKNSTQILTNYRVFYVKNIPIFEDNFKYNNNLSNENYNFFDNQFFLFYRNCNSKIKNNTFVIKSFSEDSCFVKRHN